MSKGTETAQPTELQVENALRVVDTLEIEPLGVPLYNPEALLAEGQPSGFVNAGSVTTFTERVLGQQQHDVLNSTLLAQLAANKKHDRENDVINWYGFYRYVLEQVGWVITGFNFSNMTGSSTKFTMHEAALKLLAAIASQNQMAIVTAAIEALKELRDDDRRVVLFEHNSHSANKGNFQLGTCDVGSNGLLTLSLGAFHFAANETVTRVLFYGFQRSTTQSREAAQNVVLNEQVYSQVRNAVVQKLGINASNFVAELDIGP